MRKFQIEKYHQIGLSLAVLSVTALIDPGSAKAATISLGGYTWDSANSVVSGSIVSGSQNVFGFNAFFGSQTEITNKTVGSILGFGSDTSVNLGNSINRSVIELKWGNGKSLVNAAGKDFVVYENGSSSSPEAFAVAVRKVGQNTFSQFLYQFSSGFEVPAFATAFDLSDFGIGDNEEIDAIRVMNLIATDKVTGADGQGFVGGNFAPLTGSQGSGDYDADPMNDKFDADITYVVGLHSPKPVPEPSSILGLLALGALGITSRLVHKT